MVNTDTKIACSYRAPTLKNNKHRNEFITTFLFAYSEIPVQGCKLAPVIGHLSGKFEVLTGKLRSLIGQPDGPHL